MNKHSHQNHGTNRSISLSEAYQKAQATHYRRPEYQRFTPWLSSDDTKWINPMYKDCFPVSKTRKHRSTFNTIIMNMALTQGPVSIFLNKAHYRRYKKKARDFTPSNVSGIITQLETKGYLNLQKGYSYLGSKGMSSVVTPTPELLQHTPDNFKPYIDKDGLIVLKDMDYPEVYPDHVIEAKDTLFEFNKTMEPFNQLYAVYKGGLDIDGRFHGSSVIRMPKEIRKALKIDDCETFEIDVSNCLPSLLYALELNCECPGEAYEIGGIPRDLAKLAMVTMLNCKTRNGARSAVQQEINYKYRNGLKADDILHKLELKHSKLDSFFYTGVGRRLMNIESRCMCQFIKETLQEGVKIYPIYDSAIGKKADQKFIRESFIRSFTVNEVPPVVH